MSSVLPINKNTYGATLLNESVLKDDGVTYKIATSVERAVVDHMVYYLRGYFSDVIFQYSSTSTGTTVDITGKYPEDMANINFPRVVVYVPQKNTQQLFMGDVIFDTEGEVIYGRNGLFEIIFDVWGRTQFEVEAVTGALLSIFDGVNRDVDFLSRGFGNTRYMGTLGREFDISDKIVQTVSHLDSSINIRREQLVIRSEFFYRVSIPKDNSSPDGFVSSFDYDVTVIDDDGNTITTVNITPRTKVFSQQTLITAE